MCIKNSIRDAPSVSHIVIGVGPSFLLRRRHRGGRFFNTDDGFEDCFEVLERTEHDHARRIFFTRAGFFLQQAVAEVEILCDIESEVGIERCLPRLTALPIFVVAIYIPVRPAGVEIRTDVVRNVCNHQLRLGDVVRQCGLLSRHFCTQICSEKLLDGGV